MRVSNLSQIQIDKLKLQIEKSEILSRQLIEDAALSLPRTEKNILLNFRDLVYHLSGARVVNCESSLPQENYIDYDLADLSQNRTKLTDEQILWKIYFEMAFESFQKKMIPLELLDNLSFDDIISIRGPLFNAKFQQRYDQLLQIIIDALTPQKEDEILFDIIELENIRNELESTFEEIFINELSQFQKKATISNLKSLGNVTASVALGIIGFIPGVGAAASATSILKDSPSLFFNIGQTFRSSKNVNDFKSYLSAREKILNDKIQNSKLSDRSTMIEIVQFITNSILDKLKM